MSCFERAKSLSNETWNMIKIITNTGKMWDYFFKDWIVIVFLPLKEPESWFYGPLTKQPSPFFTYWPPQNNVLNSCAVLIFPYIIWCSQSKITNKFIVLWHCHQTCFLLFSTGFGFIFGTGCRPAPQFWQKKKSIIFEYSWKCSF